MSTYDVDLTIGSLSYSFSSGDLAAPVSGVYVLDGLSIAWAFPQADPWPSQPSPVECTIQLLTLDADDLSSVDIGTPVHVVVTSAGTTVATFAGRVADETANPVRRSSGTYLQYTLPCVDYTVDLAEVTLNLVRPAEPLDQRLPAIVAAIAAAGGPEVTYFPGFTPLQQFDALNAVNVNAYNLLNDHIGQINGLNGGYPDLGFRAIMVPCTVAGALDHISIEWALSSSSGASWPPGLLAAEGGHLTVTPSQISPAPTLPPPDNTIPIPMGLVVDAGRIVEDLSWSRSKYAAPNVVTVAYPGGTVVVSNAEPGDPLVKLPISSTLTVASQVEDMASMYLPDVDRRRWSADKFPWRPTDADLAALPWSLTPDSDAAGAADPSLPFLAPPCFRTQVLIDGVPAASNPVSNLPFYGGSLSGVTLRISGGTIQADLTLVKRLPHTIVQGGRFGASWDDVQAAFPTTHWRGGALPVNTDLTWYDLRLARDPTP